MLAAGVVAVMVGMASGAANFQAIENIKFSDSACLGTKCDAIATEIGAVPAADQTVAKTCALLKKMATCYASGCDATDADFKSYMAGTKAGGCPAPADVKTVESIVFTDNACLMSKCATELTSNGTTCTKLASITACYGSKCNWADSDWDQYQGASNGLGCYTMGAGSGGNSTNTSGNTTVVGGAAGSSIGMLLPTFIAALVGMHVVA